MYSDMSIEKFFDWIKGDKNVFWKIDKEKKM
jgi:hypothetical protein